MPSETYVIGWKSKVNGRAGCGQKEFDRDAALKLVDELNREYPQIQHDARMLASKTPAEQEG